MNLQEAIVEKHAERALKGDAVVELMRARTKVGQARRVAMAHAGSAPSVRELFRQNFLDALAEFEHRATVARERGVV